MTEQPLGRSTTRTHDHRAFDAADLAARKAEAGLTVSVILPARDEVHTVGAITAAIRSALVDGVPLVDDLLVVDADSSDGTAAAARSAGARVVRQSDILPEAGPGRGKGEALWKGLAASSGDLVVFMDADLIGADEGFVLGLLGPLLTDPEVQLVKATYDRPLVLGGHVEDSGGGRVTELMARPLVSSFWPELAWLAQPLAGEYAGRRVLFEALPFVQGYGVELALLVDARERFGPEVIAQVDLGRRVHRHQPLADLGRMAAEILHVAFDRLSRQGRLLLTDPMRTTFTQPRRGAGGAAVVDEHAIRLAERPPLREWRARS